MAELAQGLGFDLADALARNGERLAHLFEGVLGTVVEAEAHLDDFFLARCEGFQDRGGLFLEIQVDHGVGGRDNGLVFDEVAQVRVFFFADGRFERDRLLGDLEDLADLGDGNVHALRDLFGGRLAAELLHQLALGADQLVDRLDHVHGDADGAGLIGNGAGDGLPDPPRRIGGELVAAAPLELVHGLHQADITLLDQVEELKAAVGVFFGDRDDEAEVGLDQFLLGLFGFGFAAENDLQRALELGQAHFAGVGNFAQLGTTRAQFAASLRRGVALGHIGAALELAGLALEGLQALDGMADLVNEALALEGIELERARQPRNSDAGARDVVARAEVRPLPRARHGFETRRLLERRSVHLADFVEELEGLPGLVLDLLLGQFLVVELNDLLDGSRTAAEVFGDGQQFLDDDRRARDRLEHEDLAALDALGDGHFALAGEQRNGAHLAQVHADRVVRFFKQPGREVEFDFVAARGSAIFLGLGGFGGLGVERGARGLGGGRVFVNVDSVALESRKQVVDLFGGVNFGGKVIVHFIVEQVTAVLAQVDELAYLIVLFFQCQCQGTLRRPRATLGLNTPLTARPPHAARAHRSTSYLLNRSELAARLRPKSPVPSGFNPTEA